MPLSDKVKSGSEYSGLGGPLVTVSRLTRAILTLGRERVTVLQASPR